jgi:transposase
MSLQSEPIGSIPVETVRIARAACPKGTLAMRLRERLGSIFEDEQFRALYPRRGQGAQAPWQLALVTLLQFVDGLTDRQAADAVRERIDWKYALGLELSDPGFDFSVLCEFRTRLVQGQAENLLLEALLQECEQHGWLKAGGRQRTDSTHVVAAIRALSDLEVVGETLRAALDDLAEVAPQWLLAQVSPDWAERYVRRVENYRLPKDATKRRALAEQIGADGQLLLQAAQQEATPLTVRQLASMQVLRAVWEQTYDVVEGQVKWRAGPSIRSPYDPEARTGKKRETQWQGYKVHVTETCEQQGVQLITHVATTPANVTDGQMTEPIQQDLCKRERAPGEHLVDTGYPDAQLLLSSRERGIELLGPVARPSSWQQRAGQGFGAEDFAIDWQRQQVTCPQGQCSRRWHGLQDPFGLPTIQVSFAAPVCKACAVRELCTQSKKGPRTLTLRPQPMHDALQQRRAEQEPPEFRARYAIRAGVEATISQAVRVVGLRRARYLGEAKTHLQHVASAAALNLLRLDAMFTQTPRGQTRRTRFARLMSQVA